MEKKADGTDDNVSPPKQAKTDFSSAFSELKKSEFFKEELPGPSKSKDSTKYSNTLLVSLKQKGNPLLKFLSNVLWEYSEIVPDYIMGKTTCALFLSIRYHQLNPDYIHERLKTLGSAFNLRVLLVQVDVPEPQHALKHLTRICILADLTLMLAWNAEDAGKIIETYKIYENKPPDAIMDRSDTAPYQKLSNALTTIRSVNKTDVVTLLSTFGTLKEIIKAGPNKLALCPGIGLQKAERIHKTLHESFLYSKPVKQ
ncbi:DNA excision repair protein ERCC-1 [Ceratina calcarata]|uniref:DNA excision repair protein ERCC-1 n=1 Tax=Ceratina calcarata TaxID=156304 RepID=A0AAJ7J291_9HYME|nr:DNA excision repair protein ERCC-1 [Ceratina calcarata]